MTKVPAEKLNVKLIAFDLDDTLLNNKTVITPRTVKAIQECARRGIYIVLCSGRPESGILPHVHALDIAGTEAGRYIIAINGSSIFDLHTRLPLRSVKLKGETLKNVHHFASSHNMGCHVALGDTIYADRDTEWTRKDSILCNMKFAVQPEFDSFLEQGFAKMLVPAPVEQVQQVLEEMKAYFKGTAEIFTSKPYFIEVMPPDTGKGQSILWLADYLKVERQCTMAFGDSFNDESMLRMVEHSVAMCNGQEAIKELCRYNTRFSNNEDGIADFLENWVL